MAHLFPFTSQAAPLTRKELAGAILLIALGVTIFLAPALRPGRVLSPADLLFQHEPWRAAAPPGWPGAGNDLLSDSVTSFEPWLAYAAGRLHAGALPLWNPNNGLGVPFLANIQTALFYPPNWIALAWPDPAVFVLRAWLKLLIGALGMYLLARLVGRVGPPAAACAAITFTGGAFVTSWLLYTLADTVVWLPWLWLATAWLVARPGPGPAAALAAGVAISLLGGHPETAYHMAQATGVFLLLLLWQGRAAGVGRALGILGLWVVAYALGGLITGVQLVPFLEYSSLSRSLVLRTERQSTPFALPTPYAWSLFSPDLWGSPAHRNWWGAPFSYNEANTYCGLLAVLLAPFALLARQRAQWRLALWLIVLCVVSLGIIYGWPLIWPLALAFPFMRMVLNHRLVVILQFALALLSALGLEAILQGLPLARRRLAAMLGGSAGALVVLALGVPLVFAASFFAVPAGDAVVGAIWQAGVVRAAVLLAAGVVVLGGLILADGRSPRLVAGGAALVPLLMFLDLGAARGDYNPTVARRDYFPPTAATTFLQAQPGPFRLLAAPGVLMPNTNLVYGLADLRSYDALDTVPYFQLAVRGDPTQRQPTPGGVPLAIGLDLLNVRYVLTAPGDAVADPRYRRVLDGGAATSSVWENTNVLPRAWLTHAVEVEPDPAARVSLLYTPSFDRAGTAVLAEPLALEAGQADPGPPSPGDSVTITTYQPETVEIATHSAAPGLLLLGDLAYPGWTATVDGQTRPILTADHALRAVYLAAGDHQVRFAYQPGSLWLGAALSLAGLVVWTVLLVLARRARRRAAARRASANDAMVAHTRV